jgi:hypothetical protein
LPLRAGLRKIFAGFQGPLYTFFSLALRSIPPLLAILI